MKDTIELLKNAYVRLVELTPPDEPGDMPDPLLDSIAMYFWENDITPPEIPVNESALVQKSDGEYDLVGEDVWITVPCPHGVEGEDISVKIKNTGEGVIVDLFSAVNENADDAFLGTAGVMFAEAIMDEECDED